MDSAGGAGGEGGVLIAPQIDQIDHHRFSYLHVQSNYVYWSMLCTAFRNYYLHLYRFNMYMAMAGETVKLEVKYLH